MPKQLTVKIATMDAELEFAIQPSTTGKQLFDQVTKTINIREVWWFGLQYQDTEGFTTWLKLKNKVTAQDVPHTKDGGPLHFLFRARYFPEDASEELVQDVTQRMFFLQVKDAILRDEIYCPPDTSVLLASYALQAKYEDYNPQLEDALSKERLLSQRVLEQHKLSPQEWLNKVVNWYKEHTGMLKEDAMLEYLKIAQDLEMYGVNYFEIKNKKGSDLVLGVDALGLNVYDKTDKLTPKIGFPWSEIRNISFREKRFIIQSVDKKAPDFVFFAPRVRINKRILALCMGNHELYMRRRKEDSIELQQMKAQAKDERLTRQAGRQRLHREREAREEAERRLLEMQERMRAQTSDNEKLQRTLTDYEERVRQLEIKLEEEARMRRELEQMQRRLEENNRALEKAKNSTAAEYEKLLHENRQIAAEIEARNSKMAQTSRELEEYQREMDRLRREREQLEAKARQLEEAMLVKEADLDDNDTSKEYGHDMAAMVNGNLNRNEEDRATAIEKNQSLQEKLKNLSADLRSQRVESKLQPSDILHEENQRQGRDKFKTLKQIRQGNTMKRVDQFESM